MTASKFNQHSRIYKYATENLYALDMLDIENKKVLTIAGSGDHLIEFYRRGAQYVTVFDINQNTQNWIDYKLACLNKYEKLADFITTLNRQTLVNFTAHIHEHIRTIIPYLKDEDSYQYTKQMLKSKISTYICTDITHLRTSINNEKFDIIYLSNIADYSHLMFDSEDHVNQFIDVCVRPLLNNLNKNGSMVPAYIYDANNKHDSDKRNILNCEQYRSSAYKSLNIASYHEYRIQSAIDPTTEDRVLILKP